MTTNIKQFYLNANDIQFIYDQATFPTIEVIGYDTTGHEIYGLSAAGIPSGVSTISANGHSVAIGTSAIDGSRVISIAGIFAANGKSVTGVRGSFDPLDLLFSQLVYHDPVANADINLPSYTSARDYQGLRNVSGDFNNLIFSDPTNQQLGWGSANEYFLRLVNPDYAHYSKEALAPLLLALPSATASDFAGRAGAAQTSTSLTDGPISAHSFSMDQGPAIHWSEWDRTTTATDTTTKVISGQHKFVDQVQTNTVISQTTNHWLLDGLGPHAVTNNAATPLSNDTIVSLAHGELDTATYVKQVNGSWVVAASNDPGAMVAHNFHGVTNGVTTQADYSDPLANVVDYTPRMISQTISSSYNQPGSALERLGAANPDLITDTATYDISNIDGTVAVHNYTEHFIENTNSYAADPSYSGWFVLFGQFFDHGLDFIPKPGGGPTIQIALAVDDPLYGKIGPDGKPTTSIVISRATPSYDSNGVLQYHNTDSPYIDQNQTYGATDQITMLLRQWVVDPNNPGRYIPGASLLDGHTVKTEYLSSVFADQGAFSADGQGLTNRTLPTLNELRAELAATGRSDLSWEDISNYRLRDANGQVIDSDTATPGIQGILSGQAIILDMNPNFDFAHMGTAKALAAITTLNGSLGPVGSLTIDGAGPHANELHLHVNAGMMGPGSLAADYYGAAAMAPWFDFATNNIAKNFFNQPDGPGAMAIPESVHAATSDLLLEALGTHYIAGDGRVNENFGLTTVHHVFHEDHNVQLVNLEATVLQGMASGSASDLAKAVAWQVGVHATSAIGDGINGSTLHHIGTDDPAYTGVNYDYSNLHTSVVNGQNVYVADLTNIRDSRGNIIMDSTGTTPLVSKGVYVDSTGHVSWNQDMMFDAAKLIVEMEYQHVAIDQYARFITPDLPEFVTYDANINSDISMEYAQAAFRFGHSQLRETIDAIETQGADHSFDVTGNIVHYALSSGFLNPEGFADVGPSAIALGMTHQVGNETDEFVTSALQQTLLGQPLDLAAINIARGRDLGVPTLNEVRKQLYDALVAERANTDGPAAAAHANIQLDNLKPYNNWSEFGNSMIHPESLVNFIAAYSFDGDVAHAQAVLDADSGNLDVTFIGADGSSHTVTAADAHAFMSGTVRLDSSNHAVVDANGDPTYAIDGAGGFNNIDLWIGGLAESHVLGGILGPTFNAIFEDQMERLMDGDRFYYLYRLFNALPEITNVNTQITNEQFKDIVERTTGVTHLNGDIMLYADSYVELGHTAASDAASEHKYGAVLDTLHGSGALDLHQGVYSAGGASTGGNGQLITVADPGHPGQYLTYVNDVRPDSPTINSNGNPTYGYDSHEVLSGTNFNDYLDSGDGDDTVYGGKGDDILIGNGGSDHLYGEDGNDILYGAGGTAGADVADFLDGGAGDDYIYGGQNAGATEVLIGGSGNDHIYGESGIDEIYGDEGDDYIDAGGDTDLAFGGGGNDEMYGGEGPDELHGNAGDDLISGGSGTDKLIGEAGDDILFGGQGGGVTQGDSDELIGGDQNGTDNGFDLADYSDSSIKFDVAADLNNQQLQGTVGTTGGTSVPYEPFNHFYYGIDGIVGSKLDDQFATPTAATTENPHGNPFGAGLVGDDNANWLIGGSGSDRMQGQGGNDVIVGGSIRLDTLIGKYQGYLNTLDANGNPVHGVIGDLSTGFLGAIGFDKHFTDLLKSESRKNFVLGDDITNANKGVDTAVFIGNLTDYKLEALDINGNVIATAINGVVTNNGGSLADIFAVRVTDSQATRSFDGGVTSVSGDGTDILIGIDKVQFANQAITNLTAYFDAPPTLDLHSQITTTNFSATDTFSGNGSVYSRGTGWSGSWTESGDGFNFGGGRTADNTGQIHYSASGLDVTGGAIQINGGVSGNGTNSDGASIYRGVNLNGYGTAHVSFQVSESGLSGNETVQVWLTDGSSPGSNDVLITTIDQHTGNAGQVSFDVTGNFNSSSRLYFVASSMNSSSDIVTIDNISITATKTADAFPGNNFSTDYTERAAGVAIASSPLITDPDGSTIVSATVHIRDGAVGDILMVGNLTGGITAIGSGSGTITLTGAASHAAYQAALEGITFSDPTNHNPTNGANTATRHVDVTVNDGFKDSNLATTTVTVHAVDEPGVAAANAIITNVGGSNSNNGPTFVVPDWALLANDSDVDSTLSINSVANSNPSTLRALSHSGFSDTITVGDNATLGGSFSYTLSGTSGPNTTATVSVTQQSGTTLDGSAVGSGVILIGTDATNTFNGGAGNDIIFTNGGSDTASSGGGDDTIVYSVTTSGNNGSGSVTSGHDIIDGGANGAAGDRFVLNGANGSETFRIFSNTDDWDHNSGNGIQSSAAHAGITGLAAGTEIVVTRGGTIGNTGTLNGATVLAELSHVEEITVNTLDVTANNNNGGLDAGNTGGDTVAVIGDFTGTSLAYSTITVNGGNSDDTVDISGLTSDHRVVFHGGGGTDHVIGDLRPQDVVDAQSNLPAGDTTPPTDSGQGQPGDDQSAGDYHGHSECMPIPTDQVPSLPLQPVGTEAADVMIGTEGADVLSGLGGDDLILGSDGADTIKAGAGDDLVKGGAGDDVILGNEGNDDLFGGSGNDLMTGDAGDDRLFGDDGNDVLEGGAGRDTVYGGAGDDRIIANVADGDDTYWGDAGEDTLDYSAISANITADLGNGLMQHGSVSSSQSGTDATFGFEDFIGGSGNDTIIASSVANVMDGGAGNDTYVFHSAADADGDTIKGFQPGDKIDLSAIDANTGASGTQSFVLFAGNMFTSAGQVIVTQELKDGVEHTFVEGNTNNDTVADFKIDLGAGNHALTTADFNGVH